MRWLTKYRIKRWTSKIIRKNMSNATPVDCGKIVHPLDKSAMEALKKIPLLDTSV